MAWGGRSAPLLPMKVDFMRGEGAQKVKEMDLIEDRDESTAKTK